MTKEKQRIAIAKACGHPFKKTDVCSYCRGNTPYEAGDDYGITLYEECKYCNNTGKVKAYYVGLPDYLNNLNLMQSVIKSLVKKDKSLFADKLMDSLGFDDDSYTKRANLNDRVYSLNSYLIWEILTQASPEKLAKAFLKTLNLWEE